MAHIMDNLSMQAYWLALDELCGLNVWTAKGSLAC